MKLLSDLKGIMSTDAVADVLPLRGSDIPHTFDDVATATTIAVSTLSMIGAVGLLPPDLQGYSDPKPTYKIGTAIAPNKPVGELVIGQQDGLSFAADNLPVGLQLDPKTGVLSGTPTAATKVGAAAQLVTVTAQNLGGCTTSQLLLTVIELIEVPFAIGATKQGKDVFFAFRGSDTDTVKWEFQQRGLGSSSGTWNSDLLLGWDVGANKWITKNARGNGWTAGNNGYDHRLTINGATHITTEDKALAVGATKPVAVGATKLVAVGATKLAAIGGTKLFAIGATKQGKEVFFEFRGSDTDTVKWEFQQRGHGGSSGTWNSDLLLGWDVGANKWITKNARGNGWTAGNNSYDHRLTINGATHITTEDKALAVGPV
jgi:hypothetical protein